MPVEYAALASTIKIEDITSNKQNQYILHRLKDNDDSIHTLYVKDASVYERDELRKLHMDYDYIPDDGEDLGWLGYYIGQNTKLQDLKFYTAIDNESFYKEMSCNTSIQNVHFYGINVSVGKVFSMLGTLLKNNHNLTEISVENGELGVGDTRQLSLAIGSCSKSLKTFELGGTRIRDGQLVDIITSMSIHPQLMELVFMGMNIGRNECTALSTLLRCTTTQLQKLNFHGNNIDDDGIELLLPALRRHTLQELKLGYNRSITGWKAVSTLLETPNSNLEMLNVNNNGIGDEGALVFANALTNNTTLKTLNIAHNNMGDDGALVFANALTNNSTLKKLDMTACGITTEGWAPFSNLLCDTSSVNKTYLSNHTLKYLGDTNRSMMDTSIRYQLFLNEETPDKGKVAMQKIVHSHPHLDMRLFFEWELKVLPIMIEWFTKATTSLDASFEGKIKKMRLSAIYDFIKAFPMLYIEAMTKQEIAKYAAMEEQQLQGDKLKEIQKRKAHAMRRLD